MKILRLVKKELMLLSRDTHGLALLFLMPVLFILIMSLAMQETFSAHTSVKISYLMHNQDEGDSAQFIENSLSTSPYFEQTNDSLNGVAIGEAGGKTKLDAIKKDHAQFLVTIPLGFSKALETQPLTPLAIQINVAPGTQAATTVLFQAKLSELIGKSYLEAVKRTFDFVEEVDTIDTAPLDSALVVTSAGSRQKLPSSVQQNVPAWLVFSMFFIAIPLSTTLLTERAQGTLHRQMSIGITKVQLLLGKLIPYILVNLIQVVLMLAVGVWLVPVLGGDMLTLGHSPLALLLISLAISFASVTFALFIANLATTIDQATVMAGTINIVLAAIGGIMVPRFIMPPTMQNISLMSPHAWGLEGFLDVFLRDGGVTDVLPEVIKLFVLGLLLFGVSVGLLTRHLR